MNLNISPPSLLYAIHTESHLASYYHTQCDGTRSRTCVPETSSDIAKTLAQSFPLGCLCARVPRQRKVSPIARAIARAIARPTPLQAVVRVWQRRSAVSAWQRHARYTARSPLAACSVHSTTSSSASPSSSSSSSSSPSSSSLLSSSSLSLSTVSPPSRASQLAPACFESSACHECHEYNGCNGCNGCNGIRVARLCELHLLVGRFRR